MRYLSVVIVYLLLCSNNSYSEPVKSVTINSSGETSTSVRYGNGPKIVRLPNGMKIKIISMGPFNFRNGDPPALVLKYETKIDLTNLDLLRTEVEEIWKVFIYDVERVGFTTAAIRAQAPLKGDDIRVGSGYGFVYLKQQDGSWNLMK